VPPGIARIGATGRGEPPREPQAEAAGDREAGPEQPQEAQVESTMLVGTDIDTAQRLDEERWTVR
jgi:hypothetical protein